MVDASRRAPGRAAELVVAVVGPCCLGLWIATLLAARDENTLFAVLGVFLVVVGAFLVLRAAGNPVGGLLLAWGVEVSFSCCVAAWGDRTVREGVAAGLLQRWLSLAVPVLWHPGFVTFVLAMLLFPHGRLLSRRWRVAVGLAATIAVLLAAAAALSPRAAMREYVPGVPPPYRSPVEAAATTAFGYLLSAMLPMVLLGVASLVLRWQRSSEDGRRQVTAFVFPTTIALVAFVVSVQVFGDGRLGFVLLPVLPVSLAVAVTRYRLYEIDAFVTRTVSYGVVTAVVVGVYVGAVELVGLLLPRAGSVAVAAATLAAAAAFAPVRRRVQRWVDRHFHRTRYDRAAMVERFRARLRRTVELVEVETQLLAAVGETVQPAAASVWVRPG